MRIATRVLVVACALGSLVSTLYAGRHNHSILLVGLFAVWVLAPFLALLGVLPKWERAWAAPAKLQVCMILLSLTVLFIYAMNAWHPLGHNAAAPFLLAPVGLWGAVVCGFVFVRERG